MVTAEIQLEVNEDITTQTLPSDVSNSTRNANSNPYLDVRKAISANRWDALKELLDKYPAALTEPITPDEETALILVARQGKKSNKLLENLIQLIPAESQRDTLKRSDKRTSNTALHIAVVDNNVYGAKLLLKSEQELATISNSDGYLPLHVAAAHGHKDLLKDLLDEVKDKEDWLLGEAGATLMQLLIFSGFYDVALKLIEQYPNLALQKDCLPLRLLALECSAFPSGKELGIWQQILYTSLVVAEKDSRPPVPASRVWLTNLLNIVVPQLTSIRDLRALHLQALELLRCLCREVMKISSPETSKKILSDGFLLAAKNGTSEVVEEILKSSPDVYKEVDDEKHSALHLAVMYRHENVFNVISFGDVEPFKYLLTLHDKKDNNILHLAGYRAQQCQLDQVSSAVLEMQNELKWFQGVQKLILPEKIREKNVEGKTPLEVFQSEHKEMEIYEGQWMNEMANSCTVGTTIIGTIAFAAAITVPGGNKGDGTPMFSGGAAFITFAISNALALFSSMSTLLIFLSILTSRDATIDFLYSLPNRLIMGLVALFFSITSMIISFSAILHLVFAVNKNIILLPIVGLALLPMTLLAKLQFPLLLNMMQSTYGHSIFTRKKETTPLTFILKFVYHHGLHFFLFIITVGIIVFASITRDKKLYL